MDFQTAGKRIRKELDDNWATTVISYPNRRFTEPDDDAWIKLDIMESSSVYATLGSNGKNQQFGIATVGIFYPVDQGANAIYGYTDMIKAIYSRKTLTGGLQFQAPTVIDVGAEKGDKWYQVAIQFPFFYFY